MSRLNHWLAVLLVAVGLGFTPTHSIRASVNTACSVASSTVIRYQDGPYFNLSVQGDPYLDRVVVSSSSGVIHDSYPLGLGGQYYGFSFTGVYNTSYVVTAFIGGIEYACGDLLAVAHPNSSPTPQNTPTPSSTPMPTVQVPAICHWTKGPIVWSGDSIEMTSTFWAENADEWMLTRGGHQTFVDQGDTLPFTNTRIYMHDMLYELYVRQTGSLWTSMPECMFQVLGPAPTATPVPVMSPTPNVWLTPTATPQPLRFIYLPHTMR